MDKKEKIYAFIRTMLEERGEEPQVGDNDSLVLSGLLDSLAIMEIVVFMEEEFGMDFSEFEFDQNKFDTINSIYSIT